MKRLMWILAVIPGIITAFAVQVMPDTVPMHYNASGEIDRWGSKYENFIFPAIIIGMTLFWQIFVLYFEKKAVNGDTDKERAEAESNGKLIKLTAIATNVMFTVMQCFFLYGANIEATTNATHAMIDIGKVSCVTMGIFFVIIGNFMPKARKNSVIGVRISWSMYNDATWMKSNRFGAAALIVTGIITIVTAFFVSSNMATIMMLGYILIMSLTICAYSYKVYKEEISKH